MYVIILHTFAAILAEELLTVTAVSTYFILYRPTGFVNGNLANYLKDDELAVLLVRYACYCFCVYRLGYLLEPPLKNAEAVLYIYIPHQKNEYISLEK